VRQLHGAEKAPGLAVAALPMLVPRWWRVAAGGFMDPWDIWDI